MLSGAAHFIPILVIVAVVLAALLYGLFILVAPILAIVAAIAFPLVLSALLGLPVNAVIPIIIYEAIVIGVLFLIKKKKDIDVSKW